MRAFIVSASILAFAAAVPAGAQEPAPEPGAERPSDPLRSPSRQPPSGTPLEPVEDSAANAKRLDDLFGQLKQEPSGAKAETIAGRINAAWGTSGSATVDLLVLRAGLAMAKSDNAAAFDFLDQAIILDPNYAEAWNRRATLNYATSNYGKSLDDIRATLRLEPRHYGALMGLAAILEETERKPQALETYLKVLEIYPTLKSAQDAVGRLSDELTGQAL